MGILVAAAAVLLLFVIWLALSFNGLVRARNFRNEGWSGIDVQLRRRHSLVPNLVEVVKGYAAHERRVLDEVVQRRVEAVRARTVREKESSESALSLSLGQLFAVVEAYPELKANVNFLELQKQLAEVEEQLALARRYYNATARNLNIRVESFPSNVTARWFGFGLSDYFEVETAAERAAPKVEMG